MTAQHSSPSPIPPWRQNKLFPLCRSRTGFSCNDYDNRSLHVLAPTFGEQSIRTYPFILHYDLRNFSKLVMIHPVSGAETDDFITKFYTSCIRWASGDDIVHFRKRDFTVRLRWARDRCRSLYHTCPVRLISCLSEMCMYFLFYSAHHCLVIIADPYYPRSCSSNCICGQYRVGSRSIIILLCATSMSARGNPSKVVREVSIFTPCLKRALATIPVKGLPTYRIQY